MAQPTMWVPAILDYMKKVRSNISTVVLAQISSSDSFLVVITFFLRVYPCCMLYVTLHLRVTSFQFSPSLCTIDGASHILAPTLNL